MKYQSIEDRELAKDFGFDVSAPNGGVQTSAVNNRLYKTECRKIYSEFLLNMRDYNFQEDQIKQELVKMRRQSTSFNKYNRDSAYSSLSSRCSSSRIASSRTDVFDKSESDTKPQLGKINLNKPRPKTVASMDNCRDNGDISKFPVPKSTTSRKRTLLENHNAVVENNPDAASGRVIKMNPRAFSKLVCGKANVHVLNKSNEYLLMPISESLTNELMPRNANRSNVPERLAIVREKTNFQSSTLSHDLKVNNLVAIKKSLEGNTSPRLTVGDVMLSARERRSRLFRIQLTSDTIDETTSPRQKSYKGRSCTGMKTPSSKENSPRLTRMNLARFEHDLQKHAIEKLRGIVVNLVSTLERHAKEESSEKFPEVSPRLEPEVEQELSSPHYIDCPTKPNRRVLIAHEPLCQYNFQNFPLSKVPKMTHDVVDDASNPRHANRQFVREPISHRENCDAVGHKLLHKRSESQRIFETQKLEMNPRLRSEMRGNGNMASTGHYSKYSSPRRISHHDTVTYVKRSKEDDEERDMKLNRWRQRMLFAVGKK